MVLEDGMDTQDLGIKKSPRDQALNDFDVDLNDAVATRKKMIELQNDTEAVSKLANLLQDHEGQEEIDRAA